VEGSPCKSGAAPAAVTRIRGQEVPLGSGVKNY